MDTAFLSSGKIKFALMTIIVLGLLAYSSSGFAQIDGSDYTIHVSQMDISNFPEVTIYVSVTDVNGKPVTDLPMDGFQLFEDGVQVIDVLDFAGVGQSRPVDIVYVFDTTGSMSEEIDGAVSTSIQFANELQSTGRDCRLGLVTFSDSVLAVYNPDDTLMSDPEEFKNAVSRLYAQGGEDDPENDYGAIKRAMQMEFREDTQVIFILITDAPPHRYGDSPDDGQIFNDPDLTKERILDLLRARTISVYSVTSDEPDFVELANETGGTFYDIERNPDFTAIIENIGEVIATQYRITYRSPRPSYDGTQRTIEVKIGKAIGNSGYLEEHLLTIQSNPLIGMICLIPLLIALMAPGLGRTAKRLSQSRQSSQPSSTPVLPPVDVHPVTPAASPDLSTSYCKNCAHPLKVGTRFCPVCGAFVVQPMAQAKIQRTCTNCGSSVKSAAKFCANCGAKMNVE